MTDRKIVGVLTWLVAVLLWNPCGYCYDLSVLPLIHLEDFKFIGGFRLPSNVYGVSDLNYAEGPIAHNPVNKSLFIVGHSQKQALAEFRIPELVNSDSIEDMNMAGSPIQAFSTILDRVTNGNSQNISRIGGMLFYKDAEVSALVVNAYEYYDGAGDSTHTTAVIRDPDNIAGSVIDGFFEYDGKSGHTSGWLSAIPSEWQGTLGGTHITGQSSGIPIIGRTSVGPSAFSFNIADVATTSATQGTIATTRLLDFSLDNPLNSDLSNTSMTNDLWTHLSRATYGFIPPGTRTYVTLGYSGGHKTGICYKCEQDNGEVCGGYCTPEVSDNYFYYWLWDLNELVNVKNGKINSYAVRPYEYGQFPTVYDSFRIGGGTFDSETGRLYLSFLKADRLQGTYRNPPIIAAYQFASENQPLSPQNLRIGE